MEGVATSVGVEITVDFDRLWHLGVLLLCVGVVVMSVLLQPGNDAVGLLGVPIPELCTFRRWTGMSCPGCGLTRSFVYMGHFAISDAFRMHWLGPVLYGLTLWQLPYRTWRLWKARTGFPMENG